MAKIKTVKFDFEGKEHSVNLNCSTTGIFSCNISYIMQKNLGLTGKLEFSSLKDLEDTLYNAFEAYKQSVTTYELMIHIKYKASGEFIRNEGGIIDDRFYPLHGSFMFFERYHGDIENIIAFDYEIVAKKICDSVESFYAVEHFSSVNAMMRYEGWDKNKIGDYIPRNCTSISSNEKLIPYSEKSIESLESIKKQLKKASMFLVDLVTSDYTQSTLENNFTNKLVEHV